MKSALQVLTVLSLAFQTGCFAIDEIDKANALLAAHDSIPNTPATAAPEAATTDDPEWGEWFAQKREQVSEWWRQALEEEPTPPNPDDGIVSCDLNGRIHILRKSDCETRGGRHKASARS
jgi:hypothetical protein